MNREQYLVYIKEYQQRRREQRRAYAVNKLGGKCANCGTTEKLEFDHIIPINVGKGNRRISELLTARIERLNKELELCQLLCEDCHKIKSAWEDRTHASLTHGTHAALRYCKPRCKECKLFQKTYNDSRVGRKK